MDYPQFHMLYMSSKELSSLDASPSKDQWSLSIVVLLVIGLCRSCRHLAMFIMRSWALVRRAWNIWKAILGWRWWIGRCPLVMTNKAIENGDVSWENSLYMAIFHNYVKLPKGICPIFLPGTVFHQSPWGNQFSLRLFVECWWWLEHDWLIFLFELGRLSSQLTNFFGEGWLNHQPDKLNTMIYSRICICHISISRDGHTAVNRDSSWPTCGLTLGFQFPWWDTHDFW